MNVGQYLLNPALVGAGLGASVGAAQKYGHDSNHSISESVITGAELGLGLGAAVVAAKVGFASKKVGQLTNPFKTSSMDTTGMTPQQVAALKMWGAL